MKIRAHTHHVDTLNSEVIVISLLTIDTSLKKA